MSCFNPVYFYRCFFSYFHLHFIIIGFPLNVPKVHLNPMRSIGLFLFDPKQAQIKAQKCTSTGLRPSPVGSAQLPSLLAGSIQALLQTHWPVRPSPARCMAFTLLSRSCVRHIFSQRVQQHLAGQDHPCSSFPDARLPCHGRTFTWLQQLATAPDQKTHRSPLHSDQLLRAAHLQLVLPILATSPIP